MLVKKHLSGPGEVRKAIGGYYTIDGAAQALGLSYWTVVGIIKKYNVPTIKIGRSVLVRLEDIQNADGVK